MLETVQSVGMQICEWDSAPLLLFSGNVFSNLIYYSHLLPAIVALLFGTLILVSGRGRLINRVMFFVMATFTVWALADLMLWATERIDVIMFTWSSLAYLEILIYMGCFYLVYLFINHNDIPFKGKLGLFAALLPVIIFAPTALNLTGFDFTNCEREALEGPLWYYIYAFEIFISALIVFMGVKAVRKTQDKDLKRQILLMTSGVVLFLISLSFGNIIGSFSYNWSAAQYGLFGMPLFTALLSYLVVRYQRFNTRVFTTQILTSTLMILVLSLIFIDDIQLIHIIVWFTFALSVVFGVLLNNSVSKEIKQRQELQRANDRLKELDKQKSEFVSFATHQLRSPISSIKGNASLILEGDTGPISPMVKDVIQTIFTSIKTMANVIEDYLNISRIELGTMKYTMNDMDFAVLAKEVMGEQKLTIEAKGLSWKLDIDESQTYKVKADPDKFKQVLMNTVDNSVKYTEKGSISVSLTKDPVKKTIIFKVSDTGVGIAPEVMPKLFQKFSRASNANVANIHGTGLGLFIAKDIMNAHGGRIWAESAGEGKGSQFYVEIPEAK
ncbi:MAG: ATP-binding protein [bacterium]|nr:ATP-binding protein [bacterium]